MPDGKRARHTHKEYLRGEGRFATLPAHLGGLGLQSASARAQQRAGQVWRMLCLSSMADSLLLPQATEQRFKAAEEATPTPQPARRYQVPLVAACPSGRAILQLRSPRARRTGRMHGSFTRRAPVCICCGSWGDMGRVPNERLARGEAMI